MSGFAAAYIAYDLFQANIKRQQGNLTVAEQTPATPSTPQGGETLVTSTPPAQDPQSTLMGQGVTPPAADPAKPTEAPAPVPPALTAPDKYEFKVPEGLPQAQVDKFTEFAKQSGLSQAQAQGLLDREFQTQKDFGLQAESQRKAQAQAWVQDVKNDPEIGNLQFDKSVELASRVVDRFGTPELKQAFNQSGFGNHPEIIRLMARIAKTMTNDQLVMPGQGNKEKPLALAELLYPKR